MAHAITDGLTVAASGVAVAMAVPENRQAGAQGVMGAAQALAAGITAIVVGALYEGFGRGAAYTAAAVGIVILVVVGMALALPFIRGQRPEPSEHPPPSTTPPTSPLPSR
jgi:MFS family permease